MGPRVRRKRSSSASSSASAANPAPTPAPTEPASQPGAAVGSPGSLSSSLRRSSRLPPETPDAAVSTSGGGGKSSAESRRIRVRRRPRTAGNGCSNNNGFVTSDDEMDESLDAPTPTTTASAATYSIRSPAADAPAAAGYETQQPSLSAVSTSSRTRVSRAAADAARIRLQSGAHSDEDEREFNRRYSRDLRHRKALGAKAATKSSEGIVVKDEDDDDDGGDEDPNEEQQVRRSVKKKRVVLLRRKKSLKVKDEEGSSEGDDAVELAAEGLRRSSRQSKRPPLYDEGGIYETCHRGNNSRRRGGDEDDNDGEDDVEDDDDNGEPQDEEDDGADEWKRRSQRISNNSNQTANKITTATMISTPRSTRTTTTAKKSLDSRIASARCSSRRSNNNNKLDDDHDADADDDDDDDDDEVEGTEAQGGGCRRSLRPRNSRTPVDRYTSSSTYRSLRPDAAAANHHHRHRDHHNNGNSGHFAGSMSANRRRSVELRNLDKYPSDEEFMATVSTQRKKKYNTRGGVVDHQSRDRSRAPKPTNTQRDRDTSSESSSDNEMEFRNKDEERFSRRKEKRMNIERAKLRPVNMGKEDVMKAVVRDRCRVGASLADVQPMEMDMNVSFSSVGGLAAHVDSLREMVVLPLLYPEVFKRSGVSSPKGVLFYGPPGTGKTLLARALACECSRQEGRKVAFFMRKGADCLSKWIGESERQLRLLFDQAYIMRPSIIFFDEVDGLAPVRSSRQDQIHSSIVSTLLALMDGLDDRGEIIVIGATNRIENIDPALRRPGRFDRELRFSLPTRQARREILALHTKSWDEFKGNNNDNQQLLDQLADRTIGYCGADLKGLCSEAVLNALRRRYPQVYQTNLKLELDLDQIRVTRQDFDKAMRGMVPSAHRMQDQTLCPLPPEIKPLLDRTVRSVCDAIRKAMPGVGGGGSRGEGATVGSGGGWWCYRPRLLIRGGSDQALTTYLGRAVLHEFETLPCHKLDIEALSSNAVRSPEEAMFHLMHEARRTVPSILYVPHFAELWCNIMSDSHRQALVEMLADVQPTTPLLFLAVMEAGNDDVDEDDVSSAMMSSITAKLFRDDEVFAVQNPGREERQSYFKPIFDLARREPAPLSQEEAVVVAGGKEGDEQVEELRVVPFVDSRKLSEEEERRLRRKEEKLLRELRIFLRDIWNKINRESKFFMFRHPVDLEEVDDYLEFVKHPMDFDTMLSKLDNNEYSCAQDFLDDIDLIAENARNYNSDLNYETNKVICHRARALQDFAYALVKAEMDTDFEDECKDIVDRRLKLTRELQDGAGGSGGRTVLKFVRGQVVTTTEEDGARVAGKAALASASPASLQANQAESRPLKRRKGSRKRGSEWSNGSIPSKKKRRVLKGHSAAAAPSSTSIDDAKKVENDDDAEVDDKKVNVKGGEVVDDGGSKSGSGIEEGPEDGEKGRPEQQLQEKVAGGAASSTTATAKGGSPRKERPEVVAVLRLELDEHKLAEVEKDLVASTEGLGVEALERIFCLLMRVVGEFQSSWDRSELPHVIRTKVISARILNAPVGRGGSPPSKRLSTSPRNQFSKQLNCANKNGQLQMASATEKGQVALVNGNH